MRDLKVQNNTKLYSLNEDLIFRRQYIIGPRFVEKFSKWRKVPINEKLFLTVHPDIEFSMQNNDETVLFLLGFILDPYHTDYENNDILSAILKASKSFEDVVVNSADYGGRFVIIYKGVDGIRLFHDPAGFRQIFYHVRENEVWAASQPHFLAEELNVQTSCDQNLVNFLASDAYISDTHEHAWAGDGTYFDGIKHLLPNHYLDLQTGISLRYWPNTNMPKLLCDDAVIICSEILQGLLKSAHHRYKLALAVTAGWDSRVLLAASKPIKDGTHYFVQKLRDTKENHLDIRTPKRLLSKLELNFSVYEFEKIVDECFLNIFLKNIHAHQSDEKIHLHYSFFKHLQGFMRVGGNVSEIGRSTNSQVSGAVSAETLAMLYGYKGDTFVITSFKDWIESVRLITCRYNLRILDLFYWEQRLGNWGAMWLSASDMTNEEFHPFNCRKLLTTLLSVDRRYRSHSNSLLYRKLIEHMWPEILSEPINLGSFGNEAKMLMKNLIWSIKEMSKVLKNNLKKFLY